MAPQRHPWLIGCIDGGKEGKAKEEKRRDEKGIEKGMQREGRGEELNQWLGG